MDQGTALVLAGAIAAAPALITVVLQARARKPVVELHDEVRKVAKALDTMNEGTPGSFASADETRRIEAIPHDERTATEQRHVDQAPPAEPPQGPGR